MSSVALPCKVLIVDDHADTAEMLRRVLVRKGITAAVVPGAQEALEYLERGERPQCLVLDEMMPGMTGLQLLRMLRGRQEYRGLEAVFYSAGYEWRKQKEAEELGARAWLVKGVARLEELVARVLEACGATGGAGEAGGG